MPTPRAQEGGSVLAGLGCLIGALCLGLAVAAAGFLLGLASYFRAQATVLQDVSDTAGYLNTLEAAVAWCGLGALGSLVATGSLILILKELADESARKQRGAV